MLRKRLLLFTAKQWLVKKAPLHIQPWLSFSGSSTERLKLGAKHNFKVEVISECWALPTAQEQKILSLRNDQQTWVRETSLVRDDDIIIVARSIFPPKSLAGKLREVTKLNNRSLGEILYKKAGVREIKTNLVLLRQKDNDFRFASRISKQHATTLWQRQRIFINQQQPFLIKETLL